MNCKQKLASAFALSAALMVGGCGGDSSGPSGGTGSSGAGSIPASVTASVESFIAYVQTIVAASSETSSPVAVSGAVGPTSETATPVGL